MTELCNETRLTIDVAFYRTIYGDLHELTDAQLVEHYHRFGEGEGRIASALGCIPHLLASIGATEDVLEIGPSIYPTIKEGRVKYFDLVDSDGLVARAASLGYPSVATPKIDYVSPIGDLSIVEDNAFDVVFSCHCIEHVPDLILHFNEVARILRPGGRYIIMAPDKRYCFEHYIPASTVADVVQAHYERRTTQSLANFIESHALRTHNETKRHWAGDHGVQTCFEDSNAVATAIQMHRDANGDYRDLHAWRFTPRSFRAILRQLVSAHLTRLSPDCVLGTARDTNTFVAILTHPA
jgi:SAM-dependent methyltransferase